MINYYGYPRWDYVISEIPKDKRPIFRWVLRDHTNDEWWGDIGNAIADGRIKKIYQPCLYDRNAMFDHIDLGVAGRFPCTPKVQLIPVNAFAIFADEVDTDSNWVAEIEYDADCALGRLYTSHNDTRYVAIAELDSIPLHIYPDDFQWDTTTHCFTPTEDYTLIEPEWEEQTVGDVIEGLIEYEQGNPRW